MSHRTVFSSILPKMVYLPLLLAVVSILNEPAFADPPYQYCPYAEGEEINRFFINNTKQLLQILTSNANTSKFFNASTGTDPYHKAYGQFLCINYAAPEVCDNCVKLAAEAITGLCPPKNLSDATVWEEVCQLRLSDKDFFGRLNTTGSQKQYNPGESVPDPVRFRSIVNRTLFELTQEAAHKSSRPVFYATKKVPYPDAQDIYALVQCTPDLSSDDCKICLENAIENVLVEYWHRGGRFLGRSCLLRYEFYDFISNGLGSAHPHRAKKWITRFVEVGLISSLLVVLGTYCCYYAIRNWRTGSEQTAHLLQLHDIDIDYEGRENPFLDFTTICAATDNFSEANKLGEGGFGPVYKGTLSNGKQLAVKRLSHRSEQGVREFTNELLLIWRLQHNNLVKLVGFCVEGQERLLAYEYMPNKGLDYFLYDPVRRGQLTWVKRLEIINGIARGILYLHEDSRLRIIHRDLKPSNVLLDSEMNPKISDLGIARIYGGSDNEANTAIIVGTYGYMAPEYAMEGIYSAKSDVFSFGVILLEILLGRKSMGFHFSGHGPSLQAYAWQEWSQGRGLELMDPLLRDSCNPDEFLRCVHVGLLCVQEDASDRPSMSSVVRMLACESATLHPPNRPAFSVGKFSDHYEVSSEINTSNGLTTSENDPHSNGIENAMRNTI